MGKCLVRKVGPFNWSSHTLVYRVAFECTGSPFRAGGLLRAPHISNLRKEQMEILIADAVFFFKTLQSCGAIWVLRTEGRRRNADGGAGFNFGLSSSEPCPLQHFNAPFFIYIYFFN